MNTCNFSIIAHVDHGKSTLADRILDLTESVSEREKRGQMLDMLVLVLEREHGIMITAAPMRHYYTAQDGERYLFNLIGTPGHGGFSYEASRALRVCEGVLLVIDAAQGVEAQTIQTADLAVDNGLEVLPVVNRIDLPSADVAGASAELEEVVGIPSGHAGAVSAKVGENLPAVQEGFVKGARRPWARGWARVRSGGSPRRHDQLGHAGRRHFHSRPASSPLP